MPPTRLRAIQADITTLDVDAIVNAANRTLLGGGGVDGAIHRAAGPALLHACKQLDGCATGQAKITQGYRLPAKYVIHTVGPIWFGGGQGEADQLRDCYRNALQLAVEHEARSIAFPAISTGIYGYPVASAAAIAVATAQAFVAQQPALQEILFCCFSDADLKVYASLLNPG